MRTLQLGWSLMPIVVLASCIPARERPLDLENHRFTIETARHTFRADRPQIKVAQGNRTFPALADTGATRSLIVVPDASHREAARAVGTEWIGAQGKPLEGIPMTLWINGSPHPGYAIAESKVPWAHQFPMLLGLDVLRAHHVVFDYAGGSTRWGHRHPSRTPVHEASALFVLQPARAGDRIILDTGAVNSYYLNSDESLRWDAQTGSTTLILIDATKLSLEMRGTKKRVGVLGMERQRREFRTFETNSGRLVSSSP